MRFGASRPDYMYLVVRDDDAVDLFVVAGAPEHLSCGGLTATEARVEDCMRAGRDSLRVRFLMTLVTPEGESTPPLADSLAPPTHGGARRRVTPSTGRTDRFPRSPPTVTPSSSPRGSDWPLSSDGA